MRRRRARADAPDVIVRLVTILATGLLLAGCSGEEGLRAQELLQQAEAAQAQLRSSTFTGAMTIRAEGRTIQLRFDGKTSRQGEWLSLQTTGIPGGGDMRMQMLVRGGRAWVNMDGRWQSTPTPAQLGGGTVSAAAFQQLARHVKDVRVNEHQLIGGKPVTTIAGEIDTEGLLETVLKDVGSFAEGFSFDLSKLGLELGDIHAVLAVDERTRLLDTATVTFSLAAEGKRMMFDLRYRLTSANAPVSLPSPPG